MLKQYFFPSKRFKIFIIRFYFYFYSYPFFGDYKCWQSYKIVINELFEGKKNKHDKNNEVYDKSIGHLILLQIITLLFFGSKFTQFHFETKFIIYFFVKTTLSTFKVCMSLSSLLSLLTVIYQTSFCSIPTLYLAVFIVPI